MITKIIHIALYLICIILAPKLLAQYQPEELFGVWQMERIGNNKIPATYAATITIQQGTLLMEMPEGDPDIMAEWTLKGDLKTMKITTENGEELWKIENISDKQLTLFDIKQQKLMIFSKVEEWVKPNPEDIEPEEDGSGNYSKTAVPEHKLMGKWSFVRSEGLVVPLKNAEMKIQLIENGTIILQMGGETIEGTWAPADDHTSIEVTVSNNTAKWWVHQCSDKELKLVDEGVLFVFAKTIVR